jgi:hypothetical protein
LFIEHEKPPPRYTEKRRVFYTPINKKSPQSFYAPQA